VTILFFPLVLACLGFLSPANRGALMTCSVVLWVLLGTPAGYVSSRLYKSKERLQWKILFYHFFLLKKSHYEDLKIFVCDKRSFRKQINSPYLVHTNAHTSSCYTCATIILCHSATQWPRKTLQQMAPTHTIVLFLVKGKLLSPP